MSKLQLLYERIMKILYVLALLFFIGFIVDLFFAISTNSFDCSEVVLCTVRENHYFVKISLPFLGIGTLVFVIAGRIFYSLAHKQSGLMTASEYRRKMIVDQDGGTEYSREQINDMFRERGIKEDDSPLAKLGKTVGNFFGNFGENLSEASKKRAEKRTEKQKLKKIREQELAQIRELEEKQKHEQDAKLARRSLNKTELIILLSEITELSQNDSRRFVNSFIEVIRDTVVKNEEVKIAKFGRFNKESIKEHTEVDPETNEEIKIEAHNTVEFSSYKALHDAVNGVVEEPIEEIKEEPVITEEPIEEIKEETVVTEEPVEEVNEEPVVTEEPIEEIKEEPVVTEEPIEEIKEEPVVTEEPVKEVKEEPVKPVVKKPAKAKPKSMTKTDIINMMDETTDLSKNKANKFLKFFAEVVKEQLAERQDVDLPGIGFFTTIEMPAKEAVNPQTNQKIIVPAHHQVRFRFEEDLKDKMNNKE